MAPRRPKTGIYHDVLRTGMHRGVLRTGIHHDVLKTGIYHDVLKTGIHNGVLKTGIHNGVLKTGMHHDILRTGIHHDVLRTGIHHDDLRTGMCNDVLRTGVHHDVLRTVKVSRKSLICVNYSITESYRPVNCTESPQDEVGETQVTKAHARANQLFMTDYLCWKRMEGGGGSSWGARGVEGGGEGSLLNLECRRFQVLAAGQARKAIF